MIDNDTLQVFIDLDNHKLPQEFEKAFEKIKCKLISGSRVYWYCKDDLEFAKDHDYDIKQDVPFSGIIFSRPETETPCKSSEMQVDDCIISCDCYPAEKEYCRSGWIALNRLLDNPELIEIYSE